MVGLCGGDRHAAVTARPDFGVKWQPREQSQLLLLRQLLASALAENLIALAAVRTYEEAHVFDNSKNRTIDLPEHLYRPKSVEQGNVLGSCDYDRAVQRDLLG